MSYHHSDSIDWKNDSCYEVLFKKEGELFNISNFGSKNARIFCDISPLPVSSRSFLKGFFDIGIAERNVAYGAWLVSSLP
ncbi:MAG: hypothetical protein QRY74_03260 [Chlamydia sp.]